MDDELKWGCRNKQPQSVLRTIPHFTGGTEENHKNSVRIGCILAEVQTEHLPNTSLESYRYDNIKVGVKREYENMDYTQLPQWLLKILHVFDVRNVTIFSHSVFTCFA
jgi:hypothetical protein